MLKHSCYFSPSGSNSTWGINTVANTPAIYPRTVIWPYLSGCQRYRIEALWSRLDKQMKLLNQSDEQPRSEPALELHSRDASSVIYRSSSPNTGSNPGGGGIQKKIHLKDNAACACLLHLSRREIFCCFENATAAVKYNSCQMRLCV